MLILWAKLDVPKKIANSRFTKPMHTYLLSLLAAGEEDVKALAKTIGVSQGHLNDMKKGHKATTLDVVDLLAFHRNRSALDTLREILGEAKKLAESNPSWDQQSPMRPTLPPEGLKSTPQKTRAEAGAAVVARGRGAGRKNAGKQD